jgi:hypothetical protein
MHACHPLYFYSEKKKKTKEKKKEMLNRKLVGYKRKRDDIDSGKKNKKKQKIIDLENDTDCLICCNEIRNATTWSCCEQQTCKKCAMILIKQMDTCSFCRQKTEYIETSKARRFYMKDFKEDVKKYKSSERRRNNIMFVDENLRTSRRVRNTGRSFRFISM